MPKKRSADAMRASEREGKRRKKREERREHFSCSCVLVGFLLNTMSRVLLFSLFVSASAAAYGGLSGARPGGVRAAVSPALVDDVAAAPSRRRAALPAMAFVPGEGCTGERVVVVGATGYIGKAVVREAVARGYATTAVVRDARKAASEPKFAGAKLVEGDVCDATSLGRSLLSNLVYCTYVYSAPISASMTHSIVWLVATHIEGDD